jgi:hypothetical protein
MLRAIQRERLTPERQGTRRGSHNDRPLFVDDLDQRLHAASVDARSRSARVPLTKRFFSGSFLKLTHYRLLTSGTKEEQCSSYVPTPMEAWHVEDIRGGGGGAGFDFAVCRDDRGLGAADPAALRRPGVRALRKKGTASNNCGLPVDTAGLRHHHCEASRPQRRRSLPHAS